MIPLNWKYRNAPVMEQTMTTKASRTVSFKGFASSFKYRRSTNLVKQNNRVIRIVTMNTCSIMSKYMLPTIFCFFMERIRGTFERSMNSSK